MADVKICVRCVLPETFPGISFNDAGECSLCQAAMPIENLEAHCAELRRGMEAVIDAARGSGTYECIVAYSGGKDSSYTLQLLVETYSLRCLAVTIDNGFMSDQARSNASTVTHALGVDHMVFRPAPAFMNHLYKQSATHRDIHAPSAAKRASNMCSSCISLINKQMIKIAMQNASPLIAGGYMGGQVPKDAALVRIDLGAMARSGAATQEKALRFFGPEASRFFDVPPHAGSGKLTIINPMLTLRVTEEQILEKLGTLGWRRTDDTGQNSTNCQLNDLGILVHYRQYGFNPYVLEMAEQVRAGLLDRSTALARANAIPDVASIADQARRIGLDLRDLD